MVGVKSKIDKLLGPSIKEVLSSSTDLTILGTSDTYFNARYSTTVNSKHINYLFNASYRDDSDFDKPSESRNKIWVITFYLGGSTSGLEIQPKSTRSNRPSSFRVFSALLEFMDLFISKYKPAEFRFTADKNELSRISFYSNKLAPLIAKRYGYELEMYYHNVYTFYKKYV